MYFLFSTVWLVSCGNYKSSFTDSLILPWAVNGWVQFYKINLFIEKIWIKRMLCLWILRWYHMASEDSPVLDHFSKLESSSPIISTIFKTKIWQCESEKNVSDICTAWASDSCVWVQTSRSHIIGFSLGSWQPFSWQKERWRWINCCAYFHIRAGKWGIQLWAKESELKERFVAGNKSFPADFHRTWFIKLFFGIIEDTKWVNLIMVL